MRPSRCVWRTVLKTVGLAEGASTECSRQQTGAQTQGRFPDGNARKSSRMRSPGPDPSRVLSCSPKLSVILLRMQTSLNDLRKVTADGGNQGLIVEELKDGG